MEGAEAWSTVGELPKAIVALKGVSLNNNIFMTGNIIVHKLGTKNILILQEDGMEVVTVTLFYVLSLMMGHGKKLERCSMAGSTMGQVWSMLMMSSIIVNNHINIQYLMS